MRKQEKQSKKYLNELRWRFEQNDKGYSDVIKDANLTTAPNDIINININ